MFKKKPKGRSLLASSIATALTAGLGSQGYAQEPAPGPELEEITITGSRIVRRDFEANSPIQTVDAEVFTETSAMAIEYSTGKARLGRAPKRR